MNLVDEAAGRAVEVLRRCAHTRGFKAAACYYPQVWARDGIIASLGALTTDEPDLVATARATLESLAEFQCPETGRIPNYIPIDEPAAGLPVNEAFDSNLWFVIGHDLLHRRAGDAGFLASQQSALRAAIRWARYMDSNNDGLVESPPCAEWMDTWDDSYHNLSLNVLYAAALSAMARMEEALGHDGSAYRTRRDVLVDVINANFWIGHEPDAEARYARCRPGHLANMHAANAAVQWISDFYFPHLPMKQAAPRRFEAMGNLTAILFGVASPAQAGRILNFIDERGVAEPYPIRVTYPPIQPGDPAWRPYYDNRGYCTPDTGHNGGIWPFVGGFHVAALVKAGRKTEAERQLAKLAELNRLPASRNDNPDWQGEWGFCEHHHGVTGRGIGAQWQAWSAGMYLYAYDAVRKGACFGWEC